MLVQTARDRLERCLWPLNHTSATHLLFQRCSSLVAGWTFPLMRHWGGYGWEGLLFCEGGGAVRQNLLEQLLALPGNDEQGKVRRENARPPTPCSCDPVFVSLHPSRLRSAHPAAAAASPGEPSRPLLGPGFTQTVHSSV